VNSATALIVMPWTFFTRKVSRWFCIVSSDSDFTRLATIREAGMTEVIGIGEKKP
jgi:hypothetical protein